MPSLVPRLTKAEREVYCWQKLEKQRPLTAAETESYGQALREFAVVRLRLHAAVPSLAGQVEVPKSRRQISRASLQKGACFQVVLSWIVSLTSAGIAFIAGITQTSLSLSFQPRPRRPRNLHAPSQRKSHSPSKRNARTQNRPGPSMPADPTPPRKIKVKPITPKPAQITPSPPTSKPHIRIRAPSAPPERDTTPTNSTISTTSHHRPSPSALHSGVLFPRPKPRSSKPDPPFPAAVLPRNPR